MKAGLAEVAARRLAERREMVHGPLATAQKALWEALMRGDITEALAGPAMIFADHQQRRLSIPSPATR